MTSGNQLSNAVQFARELNKLSPDSLPPILQRIQTVNGCKTIPIEEDKQIDKFNAALRLSALVNKDKLV